MTGLGLDVDTAIIVSDNALTHNWMETALENAAHYATDLALENPENLEEIKQHILDEVSVEVPLEALENLASWVEENPDKVASGVSVFMGAMDRNAEDRGAPSKDSKAQRRAKEKILTKAITQSPALLKDMVAKVKWGAKEVAGKKGVEKVAVQPGFKEAPPAKGAVKEAPKDVAKPGERIRHRAPQRNIVPIAEDHLVEGRVGKKPPLNDVKSKGAAHFLNKKLSSLEKAQINAERTVQLPDGRIRYYEKERLAHKKGYTRGNAYVVEHNPKTGQVRSWMESYNHEGKVTRVHPKTHNGHDLKKPHYPLTGKEKGEF